MDRNYRSITEIFFLLGVCLLGLLEVACIGSWRSLVLVGGALQKLFAVAHLLLRQEKENKLSFYLLLIAKVLLRSKSGGLYRLLVWGGRFSLLDR